MTDLERVVKPLVESWEKGDFRPHAELLAPNLVLTGFTATGDDRAQGEREIEAYLRQFFAEWSDYRIRADRVVALDDEHLLIEGRQFGVGRASGLKIDETLFVVIAARDGLVHGIHWHAYRDGALHAAGIT